MQFNLKRKVNTRTIVAIPVVLVIYYLAGRFGLNLAIINPSASAIWPPTGISIAAFCIFGLTIWPAIFIGAFLVNLTTTGIISTSIVIAIGNTLEGALAAYLLKKFVTTNDFFSQPNHVFLYTIIAGMICTMVSTSFGATSLAIYGSVKWTNYFSVWLTWWLGDAGGALIVAPVILLWYSNYKIDLGFDRVLEALAILMLLILISIFVFEENSVPIKGFSFLVFLTLPILVWTSIRFSPKESATAILVISSFAVWGTFNGYGFLAHKNLNNSLVNLQIFLGIVFITIMPLAAVIKQRKTLRKELQTSEAKYRNLVETASDAIISIDDKHTILFCNSTAREMFGYSESELIGKEIGVLMPVYSRDNYKKRMENYISLGIKNPSWNFIELAGLHKSGREIKIEISLNEFKEGTQTQFIVVIRNVTTRKKLEEETAFLASIIDSSNDAIIGKSKDFNIISWNHSAEKMYGYSADEVIGKHISIIIPEERLNELNTQFKNLLKGIKLNQYETERRCKNGSKVNVSLTLSPIMDSKGNIIGASAIERDIRDRIAYEKKLKDSLEEKEFLIKEIHHRVKNNLQVISSLLNLQSEHIMDQKSKEAFEDSRRRIKTMSLIHERLYQSNSFMGLNLSNFINDLIAQIIEAYGFKKPHFELKVNIEENDINIDRLILIGLILNELVTNSIKHAFLNSNGEIDINFIKDTTKYILSVRDNGDGFPPGYDIASSTSLGLTLVNAFVSQLKGDMQLSNSQGTQFRIIFPVNDY